MLAMLCLLTAGCAGNPETDSAGHSSDEQGDRTETNDGGRDGSGKSRDGENKDKNQAATKRVAEQVYNFEDLVVGVSPGTSLAEESYDVYGPTIVDSFDVEGNVTSLRFTPAMNCGTGSARILVYNPDGRQVYTSDGWNLVGVPDAICVAAEEQLEDSTGPYSSGTYEVRIYTAGAVELGLTVTALRDVPA